MLKFDEKERPFDFFFDKSINLLTLNTIFFVVKSMIINKNIKKDSIKSDPILDKWYLIDAKDQILGRLSSFLAIRLMGKHKVSYSDNESIKDKIVVINAKKIIGSHFLGFVLSLEPVLEPAKRFKENAESFGYSKEDAIIFKIGEIRELSKILK